MAIVSKLHNTNDLGSLFLQMPSMESNVSFAVAQFSANTRWLDDLGALELGSQNVQITSTSTQLSYTGSVGDSQNVSLVVKGTGLPVFNALKGEWSSPSKFTVSSLALAMPNSNNTQFSVTGTMSIGQTSSSMTLKEVKLGDDNLMTTLKGSLTIKVSGSADPQISGSITGLKFDVLKGDGVYYHLEATLKATATSVNITALKVTEDGVGTLFEASKLSVDLAKVDTHADNFITNVLLAGADTITGTSGNDYIDAGAGNDKITVGGGDNTIIGGTGNDTIAVTGTVDNTNTIVGSAGADKITITNSLGVDTFVFDSLVGADTITGFNAANDKFAFDTSVFTALSNMTGENVRIGAGLKTAADTDDFLIFDTKGGGLYYDADGNGAGKAVLIATVKGSVAAVDFSNFGLL